MASLRELNRKLTYVPLVALTLATIVSIPIGVVANYPPPQSLNFSECQGSTGNAGLKSWVSPTIDNEAIWLDHSDELQEPFFRGENGWLFWGDYVESYASQAVGRVVASDSLIDDWRSYFQRLSESLEAKGIAFFVIIAPSTTSIYPEQLPVWMQKIRSQTSLDKLMAVAGDLPIIDLRAALVNAKTTSPYNLYSWSNSHWTDYGAYRAWPYIASCINSQMTNRQQLIVPVASSFELVPESNEWEVYGQVGLGADWMKPLFGEDTWQEVSRTYRDGVPETVEPFDQPVLSNSPIETRVSRSWTNQSAVIFRDSMGGALAPYFQQAYSPAWQIDQRWSDGWPFPEVYALVRAHEPDVIIMELAERHLITTPVFPEE
jgi:hypothetical protein